MFFVSAMKSNEFWLKKRPPRLGTSSEIPVIKENNKLPYVILQIHPTSTFFCKTVKRPKPSRFPWMAESDQTRSSPRPLLQGGQQRMLENRDTCQVLMSVSYRTTRWPARGPSRASPESRSPGTDKIVQAQMCFVWVFLIIVTLIHTVYLKESGDVVNLDVVSVIHSKCSSKWCSRCSKSGSMVEIIYTLFRYI